MKNLSSLFGKDNLDEIVFSNRNKAYGAYALRNEYSNQLTKALFVGVAFFASVSVIPLVISAFDVKSDIPMDDDSKHDFIYVDEHVDTPKPTPEATVPTKVKTVASEIVTPVRVVKKNKPAPTEDDKKGAALSSETSDGPETTLTVAPPAIKVGPPVVAPPYVPPTKPVDPNELYTPGTVDVAADFKGGINAFRDKVAQNFDTESVDKSGLVSGVITFVVEKDGSISNLKVNGSSADFNSEAERTVKSIKTKWTPAQVKGKAVRSSFRMPISMKIE
ncbi:energy transducer TonB [Epilithonimonas sp. JDS]|uniref:energy transducer TonB n=1 Tax=Epilithonimonas sp. JDS TaxID=2902797 RepID=UPI001E4F88FC|nr:energy transducer TonB [Epilithonimonas sp. JDS]MCD9856341.1 energy transducer TonB [Epilithonimonas sp. JDS]